MEELLQNLRYFLSLPLTSTADEIAAELTKLISQIKEATGATETITAKHMTDALANLRQTFKTALSELGLPETAGIEEVKTVAAKHKVILAEIGGTEKNSVDELKQMIVAKAGSAADPGQYVRRTEFEAVELQLIERDAQEIVAKHVRRGAVAPYEVDDLVADVKAKKIAAKALDERLGKRADNSLVPLGQAAGTPAAGSEGVIDQVTLEIAGKMGLTADDVKTFGK